MREGSSHQRASGKAELMEFVVGCDWEKFERYYRALDDLHSYFRTLGLEDVTFGEVGDVEKVIIESDPSHLIVWRENDEIIGHAVWHESSTEEHRRGAPRDRDDRQVLRRLAGRGKEFVELHEVWLRTKYRGRGYGKRFFEFFEDFVKKRGFDSIVYYTDDAAAMAICRKRGYREDFLEKEKWHIFYLNLEWRV
jgi:GNAT superfamily N-acetyltransferase